MNVYRLKPESSPYDGRIALPGLALNFAKKWRPPEYRSPPSP